MHSLLHALPIIYSWFSHFSRSRWISPTPKLSLVHGKSLMLWCIWCGSVYNACFGEDLVTVLTLDFSCIYTQVDTTRTLFPWILVVCRSLGTIFKKIIYTENCQQMCVSSICVIRSGIQDSQSWTNFFFFFTLIWFVCCCSTGGFGESSTKLHHHQGLALDLTFLLEF